MRFLFTVLQSAALFYFLCSFIFLIYGLRRETRIACRRKYDTYLLHFDFIKKN